MISQNELKERLDYDQATGIFTRKLVLPTTRPDVAGKPTGKICRGGYRQIYVCERHYMAHRLAWLWVYGEWPPEDIDHINRNRDDNRACNLRLASRSENIANTGGRKDNRLKCRGVHMLPSGNFRAAISKGGKRYYLGIFAKLSDASAAYKIAQREMYGEFSTP